MTSGVAHAPLAQIDTPLLAVALSQGSTVPASLADLDRASGGVVTRAITSGDFKGKRDETTLLYPGGAKPARVLLVGLGKPGDVTRNTIRRAAAVAAKRARALGAKHFTFAVPLEARNGVPPRDLGQVAVEGAAQGAWAFTELKKAAPDEAKPEVESVTVVCDQAEARDVTAGTRVGDAVAAGHRLTRYLQMLPGNVCTPTYLADRAKELANEHGFAFTVLDRAQLQHEGMGALLAVAQGSQQEPRFIVLEYRGGGGGGGGGDAAPVALVGKGVTFDSGGISIKPAQNMEDMKFDMSGAAAVLGTFETLGRLKPKLNVVGVIPATENLPSGTAVKPGDVVKSHLGKTIEIINTDAEGRLILCDALSYVRRFKPAAVIDIATLTGAVVVALGQVAVGAMGNDEPLLAEVRDAGERAGERVWPLPLWDEYRELLKSDIADVKNSGGRGAGSIAGGWFLREFVEGYPWVHLDIAGTAYTDGEGPHQTKGPTAVGVRLFTEFILKRAGA
ncbi:MAG: leucyl aminopeptidase [Gemmatimonadetes bacterium]|nr:MAG: leucyl aminopeptidase [Gemmatimonadota bacterium]